MADSLPYHPAQGRVKPGGARHGQWGFSPKRAFRFREMCYNAPIIK